MAVTSISFKPEGVCAREMIIEHENGIIVSANVIGGCNGNLQGICKLVVGMPAEEVIKRLSGIKCRGSRTGETSCPDQLAKGLKKI